MEEDVEFYINQEVIDDINHDDYLTHNAFKEGEYK